ncbi:ankyrin repeat domain 40 [Holotrichia oblita]|uniref:Ankyrin repeat domain 40 n=1 Tax=Holotrichia oblita TaxID=644536 RepID=A0ACB9STE3_HOLOL|nr:ankyrin repeat domain 40 [Holotrichia oblita]
MANILEEKLREASSVGDVDAVQTLIAQNVDINSKNVINGWTALHWASRRGQEQIVRILLNNGADTKIENNKNEKPADLCTNPNILTLLGETPVNINSLYLEEPKFAPNYLKNPPLNGQVDIGKLRARHSDFFAMPTTVLPAQNDDLVLKIRIAGSNDPDFIEVEVPRWKLFYATLMKICCEELKITSDQVERIRKLPNTRLRKDSDVKRLTNFQCLEIVLKAPNTNDKYCNSYQSISTHKDQTILY